MERYRKELETMVADSKTVTGLDREILTVCLRQFADRMRGALWTNSAARAEAEKLAATAEALGRQLLRERDASEDEDPFCEFETVERGGLELLQDRVGSPEPESDNEISEVAIWRKSNGQLYVVAYSFGRAAVCYGGDWEWTDAEGCDDAARRYLTDTMQP